MQHCCVDNKIISCYGVYNEVLGVLGDTLLQQPPMISYVIIQYYHISMEIKWLPFCWWHFQMHFLKENWFLLIKKSSNCCFLTLISDDMLWYASRVPHVLINILPGKTDIWHCKFFPGNVETWDVNDFTCLDHLFGKGQDDIHRIGKYTVLC